MDTGKQPKARPRMLEWVGQSGVFANPVVQYNLAFNRYSDSDLRVLRMRARRKIYRANRHVIRMLRPDSPAGLSKNYQWGPWGDSYVQPVAASDAKIILEHPKCGREFLDVTDLEPLGPIGTPRHALILPVTHANPAGLIIPTDLRREVDELTAAIRAGR